jgi:adenylate kinase
MTRGAEPVTRLVMLGPPASGKGTQGKRLALTIGVPHVSSGSLLRRSMAAGDPFGVGAMVSTGRLVPDDVVEALLEPALGEGFVLDGYPRTDVQAGRLDALLERLGRALHVAVELAVDDDRLIARMQHRASVESRSDDTPEVFERRLATYRAQIVGLRSAYAERLVTVDGDGNPDEVFAALLAALRVA